MSIVKKNLKWIAAIRQSHTWWELITRDDSNINSMFSVERSPKASLIACKKASSSSSDESIRTSNNGASNCQALDLWLVLHWI